MPKYGRIAGGMAHKPVIRAKVWSNSRRIGAQASDSCQCMLNSRRIGAQASDSCQCMLNSRRIGAQAGASLRLRGGSTLNFLQKTINLSKK
ncbi:hypothetical protein [Neobacillus notoginsengisoli]|uniref:hypothetical protein n=1 Tax=Neobacillus notoginsengisoli TaxID=1578198 RepID=UPI001314A6E3|nr:hypothetical protein [Neobacillus notoginsengisoli]